MNIQSLRLCAFVAVLTAILVGGASGAQAQNVCAPERAAPALVTSSPVAPAITPQDIPTPPEAVIRDLERDEKGFPKWSNFPSAPQNVLTASDIRQRVTSIKAQETALETAVAQLKWDINDPEAVSAAARKRLNSELSRPVTKNSCAEIHQYALTQRAKAVPPASPDR